MNQEPVKIEALPNASRRTKNRIKEHGPFFVIRQTANHIFDWEVGPCEVAGILLASEDSWFGWVPANEVRIGD